MRRPPLERFFSNKQIIFPYFLEHPGPLKHELQSTLGPQIERLRPLICTMVKKIKCIYLI